MSKKYVSDKPMFVITGRAASVVDVLAKMSLSADTAPNVIEICDEVEEHYRLPGAMIKARSQAWNTLKA